jgi:hypothetical protein
MAFERAAEMDRYTPVNGAGSSFATGVAKQLLLAKGLYHCGRRGISYFFIFL